MNEVLDTVREQQTARVREKLRRELGDDVCGALDDPQVLDIILNSDGNLWMERLGQPLTIVSQLKPTQAEAILTTVAAVMKTSITRDTPIIECELPFDGSRFSGLIPPVVPAPCFAIRRKASQVFSLEDYVRQNILSFSRCRLLQSAVVSRKNILVVGGTGSGKTTFLNALVAEMVKASPEHRLLIIEDTPEIQCTTPNQQPLRTSFNVDMQRLLKSSMRLRPDRIIVGEVRGGEALSLLKAWNTGHPGGCASLHANGARAGLIRLEQLIAEASTSPMRTLIGEAVDYVVAIVKTSGGGRTINELSAVEGYDEKLEHYVLRMEGCA